MTDELDALEERDPATGLRTYQGRVLPDQTEEVVDQGLRFDVQTLLDRRRLLLFAGIGLGTLGLAACTSTSSSSGSASGSSSSSGGSSSGTATLTVDDEIPEETNGPYPGDGTNGPDVLEQSGVIRKDIRTSFGTGSATASGVPMTLRMNVRDMANDDRAFAGAAVYVWHCDRDGKYSMYSGGLTNENYLRGVQIADADGWVEFTSIYPACYSGRWPHIHFEVYEKKADISDHDTAIATSQIALPKAVNDVVYATDGYEQSVRNMANLSLDTDNVFSDTKAANQLATVTGSVQKGYTVSLTFGVDTTTEPGVSGSGGGGDGTPPSGGPGEGAPPSS